MQIKVPLTPARSKVLADSEAAQRSVSTVQRAVSTVLAGNVSSLVDFKEVAKLLDFIIPEGTFNMDEEVVQAQVTITKEISMRRAALSIAFDSSAKCEAASQKLSLCKLVKASGIATADPQMQLLLQHGPQHQKIIQMALQVGPVPLNKRKCGGKNTEMSVATLTRAELFARGEWGGTGTTMLQKIPPSGANVLSRGTGVGLSVDFVVDIHTRTYDTPCGRMIRPMSFSGVLMATPTTISGKLAMQGLLVEPFGLQNLYLSSMYLGMSFGYVEDMTIGGQIEAEGHLALGTECYVIEDEGEVITRVTAENRVCIEGTVALGIALSLEGVSLQGNYLAATINRLTVGNLIKLFAKPDLVEQLDSVLPRFVQDSGFPGPVTMSFATDLGGATTINGRRIPYGLYFNGKLNFLGYGIQATAIYQPGRYLQLTAAFDRFDQFAPLFVLSNPSNPNTGPLLNISVVHDFSDLSSPKTHVSVLAQAQIEILGTTASTELIITDSLYTLDVVLSNVLGIKQLSASTHLEAKAGPQGLKGANFEVLGELALTDVKIPTWVRDTVNALRGLSGNSPVKGLADKLKELPTEDVDKILAGLKVPETTTVFKNVRELETYMSARADDLEKSLAGQSMDMMSFKASFKVASGSDGTELELSGEAALLGKVHAFKVGIKVGFSYEDVIDLIIEAALGLFLPDGIADIIHAVKNAISSVRTFFSALVNAPKGLYYNRNCGCIDDGYTFVGGKCHAVGVLLFASSNLDSAYARPCPLSAHLPPVLHYHRRWTCSDPY